MSTSQNNDLSFEKQLVITNLRRGYSDLATLAQMSGGIYPGDLKEILENLDPDEQIRDRTKPSLQITPHRQIPSPDLITFSLPGPHPHDSDWRYDKETCTRLALKALNLSRPHYSILLLGAPKLFLELATLHHPQKVTLIDSNESLLDSLKGISVQNAFQTLKWNLLYDGLLPKDDDFFVAVCDPPWYLEEYSAFIAQALSRLSYGGYLLLSLLPIAARPGAMNDRERIFSAASKLGLHLTELLEGWLTYETPPFEISSLRKVGIDLSTDWRPGDLAVFRKVRLVDDGFIQNFLRTTISSSRNDEIWNSFLLGNNIVKIRGPFDDYYETPKLLSIELNDLLPTVSRRYSGRDKIDLWLWDNRVFGLKGRAAFRDALKALSSRKKINTTSLVSHKNRNVASILLRRLLSEP